MIRNHRWQAPPCMVVLLWVGACSQSAPKPAEIPETAGLEFPLEKHFKNIRQLTFEGTNAEAYWSFDGKWLTFQHKGPGLLDESPECDQIYAIRPDGTDVRRISNGKGRTTCSYFFPDHSRILFSSTFQSSEKCPTPPDMSRGYVWPVYNTFQIYTAKPDGTDILPLEPGAKRAYHAEATVCHDGSVIFTSDRDGDLDLYRGKLDSLGTLQSVERATTALGYDGGAFFSPDCKKIVWRASRPRLGKETEEYIALLKRHEVKPSLLEIWIADADGRQARQLTRVGAASFAPSFVPDGRQILFASNPRDPHGRSFDLYKISINGTGLERVSFSDTFESFPMFSPDGKQIAFSSNRNAKKPRDTNVFVADWVGIPTPPLSLDDPQPENRFLALVEKLSSLPMEGRGVGTAGMKQAEKEVIGRFEAVGLKPFFTVFPKAQGGVDFRQTVEIKSRDKIHTASNLVGVWGEGCLKTAPVIIGAHLDHLGHGAENSLEPNKTGIHPGADDNASGIAALIESARMIAASQEEQKKKVCYIFAAFTGEELGIAGSSRFVELLKNIKVRPKAMLNMDMVGRMENNRLIIFGTASAKEWEPIVQAECSLRRLDCPGGGDGYGPSDHMAFYTAGVPVLHFFTGPHTDYHRVSDTADKINATGGIQTSEVVANLAIRAASTRFHYQKASSVPMMGRVNREGGRKSHGAYLGTIPDYSQLTSPHGPSGGSAPGGGVRLAGARAESPAAKAGIKEGDILVSIDDRKTNSLEDFMNVLVDLMPNQEVILGVRRGRDTLKLHAVVGKRE